MRFHFLAATLIVLVNLGSMSRQAFAAVNVSLEPAPYTVDRGVLFELQLLATSDNDSHQAISALDVVFAWDPEVLEFVGALDDSPYAWLTMGFFRDAFNDDFDDGNAKFTALANFTEPALASPGGLVVASLQFRALRETSMTTIVIVESTPTLSATQVFGANAANQVITGLLHDAPITVSAANDLTLNVPLSSQSVLLGDTVIVTLDVFNLIQPINGVQAFIKFDPTLLELVDVAQNSTGGDLGSGWIVGNESVSDGIITYIVALFGDSMSSDDNIATFTFTAFGSGTTQVTFDTTAEIPSKLTGIDNSVIVPNLVGSDDIGIIEPVKISAIDTFYSGRFADAADPSRTCLAVGTVAGSQNITNYIRGITGIRVQFTDQVNFALTPDEAFSFSWTTCNGTTFTPITAPAGAISVTAKDADGKTSVDIVFEDNLIRRRWLKVRVDATQVSSSGLSLDGELQGNPIHMPSGDGSVGGDAVFFLGNMAGDVNENGVTDFTDAVLARSQLNPFLSVPIDNTFDIDKSGGVVFFDAVLAHAELNEACALPLIAP